MKSIRLSPVRNVFAAALLLILALPDANAVPSYARQTGQACIACHVSFPELTPYGRYFKLTGYTIGTRQDMPFAAMVQAGVTWTQQAHDSAGVLQVPRDGGLVIPGGSVFLAGKATDNIGGFVQWTLNNFSGGTDANGNPTGGATHGQLDNFDLRAVGRYSAPDAKEPALIYGLTLHNNPTVQDVWNSTPAFGFPFTGPPFTVGDSITPAALIDGSMAQHVAGLGGYLFWNKTLYGEISFYRTADGAFSALRAGQDTASEGGVNRLKGYNPYWRFAYNHEWGPSSIMVGTFGMQADRYPSNLDPTTPTDRFTDTAVDAQYQYITDPHTVTAQVSYIHEKQNLNATFNLLGASANPTNTLNTFKAKTTYYYQRIFLDGRRGESDFSGAEGVYPPA
jgi:hypothetical protein